METKIQEMKKEAVASCAAAQDLQELQKAQVHYLGKKGAVTSLLRNMGQVAPEDRPKVGQLVNQLKNELEEIWNAKEAELVAIAQAEKFAQESVDISLPGRKQQTGTYHPLTLVTNEIKSIFISMGYQVIEGPEIETDYYNFEALNIPPDHPARDMQDTFYITNNYLLRSQTSPVQVRTMERQDPPVRMIAPGKVYRSDSDVTHSPMFHQVEGLLIDEGVTFADLKGTLQLFAEKMFGREAKTRFRPSYFPFTEPSAEVDVSCIMCKGKGCRVCSDTGWLEILGSGMVDPKVLKLVGYDTEKITGFAFGDIRLLFENDQRFLNQFK